MANLVRNLFFPGKEFSDGHDSKLTLGTSSRSGFLRPWLDGRAVVFAIYVAATWLTSATFMGDTADYIDSITAHSKGVNYRFWEFGHLLWRPFGWAISSLLTPLTRSFVGDSPALNATLTLIGINWLAGLICVLLLRSLLIQIGRRRWVANLVAIGFIFTQGFLNYAQAGTSYVAALAPLMLGLHVLAKNGDQPTHTWRTAVFAGMAFAASVCLWFPFVLVIPAALLSPLFFFGTARRRWRLVLQTAVVCAFLSGLAYFVVMAGLRLDSVEKTGTWITAASRGTGDSGVKRMVFGLARSFINMGNDGLLFKRYLLRDPFNPVSVFDLLRLSVWKLALFYLFVGSILTSLLRSPQSRRILVLVIVGCVPVIVFGIFFRGGDIERYLPLYPLIFLALASCLDDLRTWLPLKAISLAFVVVMIVTNALAMATFSQNRKNEAIAARIGGLLPRLDSQSLVYVANWQDELINFNRSFPFHPINRSGRIHLNALITPGTLQSLYWRKDFASRALAGWSRGGAIWVSKRAFSPRPPAEWNWAEGDDRYVSWTDFPAFFSQMDMGDAVGGDDGFMRLLPSSKSEQFLKKMRASH